MELKDFIGKVVVSPKTNRRYWLREITAPEIGVKTVDTNRLGYHEHYCYTTVNGDPFTVGTLVFEDASLTEPFLQAYNAYCSTEDARWESYYYYLMRE